MDNYFKKAFGQRLKSARIKRFNDSVSQKEFAQMLEVKYRTYQNWELGVAMPKDRMLLKIANWLKVDPRDLRMGPRLKLPDSTKELIKEFFPPKKR